MDATRTNQSRDFLSFFLSCHFAIDESTSGRLLQVHIVFLVQTVETDDEAKESEKEETTKQNIVYSFPAANVQIGATETTKCHRRRRRRRRLRLRRRG